MKETERYCAPYSVIPLLVGNKADLQDSRVISREEAEVVSYKYWAIPIQSKVEELEKREYLVYKLLQKYKLTAQK